MSDEKLYDYFKDRMDRFEDMVETRFDKADIRFDKVEERQESLFAFKWKIIGGSGVITILAGVILELILVVVDHYLK